MARRQMENVTYYKGYRIVTACSSEDPQPRSAGYRVYAAGGGEVAHGAVHGNYTSERAAHAAALAAGKEVVDRLPPVALPTQF